MRISRPCYDKFHRCPGWAGGGTRSAKTDLCDGGYINGYEKPHWRWRTNRCPKCDVLVLPFNIRYVDLRYWTRWKIPGWWGDLRYWWKLQLCCGCGSTNPRWHADYCPADGWGEGVHHPANRLQKLIFEIRWYFRHNFLARWR